MAGKQKLYEVLIERMGTAHQKEAYLEEIWLAYVILEDRLRSILIQSGGIPPRRMMLGDKIEEIKIRSKRDIILKGSLPVNGDLTYENLIKDQYIPTEELKMWKDDRNTLMHGMAEGNLTITEIDKLSFLLAIKGNELAKQYCDSARRYKKRKQ